MSSCDPCGTIGPNGAPGGGGGGGPVTLQAAITGQGVVATAQAFQTTWGFNAGGSLRFNDAAAAALLTVADVTGVQVGQSFALTGDISPAALAAGNTNNYAPAGLATASTLRLTPDATNSQLSSITTGADGRVLVIMNIGTAASLTLLHDDGATGTAANRFLCPNNLSVVIPPNGTVAIEYDSTSSRWRVITPQQSSATFNQTMTQVGATLGTLVLANMPAPGDRVVVRNLSVSAIFTAGIAAGDVGQIAFGGVIQAQNATTDAQTVLFAPQPWGPPPTPVLQPTSTGYQPPLAFASPGGIAIGIGIVANTIVVVCLGIGGFTTRFDITGELYLYAGATRTVA